MIYSTDIMGLFWILLIWILDAYLFLVAVRLVVGRLSSPRTSHLCGLLGQVTDTPPRAVEAWIGGRTSRAIPAWLPWVVVLVAVLLARQLMAWIFVMTAMGGA